MTSATLWVSSDDPVCLEGTLLLWAQFPRDVHQTVPVISLPELVEEDAKNWRARYLTWLEALGGTNYGGLTLVEALKIRPGLSYWWMTVPSEFSLSPDSIAYAVIRLWALEEVARNLGLERLEVVGGNSALKRVLRTWSRTTSISITFRDGHPLNPRGDLRGEIFQELKRLLPARAKGLLFIIKVYLQYFTLKRPTLQGQGKTNTVVVDYLAHFDAVAAYEGRYESHFWGPLVSEKSYLGGMTDWVHIDVRSATLPTSRKSKAVIRAMNEEASQPHHFLAQSFFDFGVLLRAFSTFHEIAFLGKRFDLSWKDSQSEIDFRPIFEDRLVSDFSGTAAASNAIWLCLFEKILQPAVRDREFLFLWENQPWELAALHARKSSRSPANIGVAHLPIRYWDLRHFLGYSDGVFETNLLPQPDIVAVPDATSVERIDIPQLPAKTIFEVEALRFKPKNHINPRSRKDCREGEKTRILVLGELLNSMVQRQLKLVESLLEASGNEYSITFRPHPASSTSLPILNPAVSLSENSLASDDYQSCDAVLCSSITASSLEAHIAGVLVMIYRDGRAFSGTPLIPGPRVAWVTGADDIKKFIDNYWGDRREEQSGSTFPMNFSKDFTRWGALFSQLRSNRLIHGGP